MVRLESFDLPLGAMLLFGPDMTAPVVGDLGVLGLSEGIPSGVHWLACGCSVNPWKGGLSTSSDDPSRSALTATKGQISEFQMGCPAEPSAKVAGESVLSYSFTELCMHKKMQTWNVRCVGGQVNCKVAQSMQRWQGTRVGGCSCIKLPTWLHLSLIVSQGFMHHIDVHTRVVSACTDKNEVCSVRLRLKLTGMPIVENVYSLK